LLSAMRPHLSDSFTTDIRLSRRRRWAEQ